MVDTVSMWCKRSAGTQLKVPLERERETFNTHTQEYSLRGNVRNLSVLVTPSVVRIMGSLSAFKYGNNIGTLNTSAIAQVCDELREWNLDPDELTVTRLDLAQNFELSKPINHYIGYLDTFGRMPVLRYENGVRSSLILKDTKRELTFYNKYFEARKNKLDVSGLNPNLTRYESRLRRYVHEAFGVERLSLSDLTERPVYHQCASIWHDYYFKIKRRQFAEPPDLRLAQTPKAVIENLTAHGLFRIGGMTTLSQVLRDQWPGNPNRSNRSNLNKKARELTEKYKSETPATIMELDACVQEAYERLLDS
jgi:hypothetical protein